MYVGFSVLAAGAKLPSISAPQLPVAKKREVGSGVRFASQSGN